MKLTLKRELIIASAASLAVGYVVGFLITDRRLMAYYDLVLQGEVEDIKRASDDEIAEIKRQYEEATSTMTSANPVPLSVNNDKHDAEAATALSNYQPGPVDPEELRVIIEPLTEADVPKSYMRYDEIPGTPKTNVETAVEGAFAKMGREFVETITPKDETDETDDEEEVENNDNVGQDTIVDRGGIYSEMRREFRTGNSDPMPNPGENMDPDKLYEVSYPIEADVAMLGEEEGYESSTITYYLADDVLVDERDVPCEDVIRKVVGLDNLRTLANGEDEVLYVRNDKMRRDFEIVRNQEAYGRVVLGFDENDEPILSARPRGERM